MEDRFKFRAWNKNQEYMYKNVDKPCIYDDEYLILMQCTGLKDKNGTLIYEKDYLLYKKYLWSVSIDKFCGIVLTNILNGDIILMDDVVLYNCEVKTNEFECDTKI